MRARPNTPMMTIAEISPSDKSLVAPSPAVDNALTGELDGELLETVPTICDVTVLPLVNVTAA